MRRRVRGDSITSYVDAEKDDSKKNKLVYNQLHTKKSVMEIHLTSMLAQRKIDDEKGN